MLAVAGAGGVEELFADIPKSLRLNTPLRLPAGLAEPEVDRLVRSLAGRNRLPRLSFLGGGAYPHYSPAAVDAVIARGEFLTSYTPYQPEVAQGALQAIWEYQSLVAGLTGLAASNASLYDSAEAALEAALMCLRDRPDGEILVSRAVDPRIRAPLAAFARTRDIPLVEIGLENGVTSPALLASCLTPRAAGVLVQSPNYFGLIEDSGPLAQAAHENGSLFVSLFTEAVSLGLLKPPGECGADIAAGEGLSLGLPLSWGGPGLGIIACTKPLLRRLPGRIVGRTVDAEGKPGFVLTLQAREQHIRREAAASNVCSNHALSSIAAAAYLAALGREGFAHCARLNYHKAHYARKKILSAGVRTAGKKIAPAFPGPFFNEFAVRVKGAERLAKSLDRAGIAAGILLEPDYPELRDCLLIAVTEKHSRADIDELAEALR